MHCSDTPLLGTRFGELARNTIDYWMAPDDASMTAATIAQAIEQAPVLPGASLSLYIHVPFCAQRCRFCAFSGGNSPDTRLAERYAALLVAQLNEQVAHCPMRGQPIRAVNIGGGSPDLLGVHIARVLDAIHALPGFGDHTELAVEMTASTTRREFVDILCSRRVDKASFGIQSLDPDVRRYMRQPASTRHVTRLLEWIDGRIPIVNADVITGLPGQTLATVEADLNELMQDPRINAISSYLLTTAAAPSLLAATADGTIPQPPAPLEQALMRLSTYGAFRRAGWIRRGTNTYIDPNRIDGAVADRMAGHECIGAGHYEAFLLGVGPQAVSCMPGVRAENIVDVADWCAAVERGDSPFYLPKCSTEHQRDMALWVFPLRWEGLPEQRWRRLVDDGAISQRQLDTLAAFEHEGLVERRAGGYALSVLGEVFMGHLVRGLKSEWGQRALDSYVDEGHALAAAAASKRADDANRLNNRQVARTILDVVR